MPEKCCLFFILVFLCQDLATGGAKLRSIYQRIAHEEQFSEIFKFIKNERLVVSDLQYSGLTIFVPVNNAIEKSHGNFHVRYHITYQLLDLNQLLSANFIHMIVFHSPPVWITKKNGDVYLNNAKLLIERSNYISKTFNGEFGKKQILHMIDDILHPGVSDLTFVPNAFDFLSSSENWNIGPNKVQNFFQKVLENKLQNIFKQNGSNTYFIPVDYSIDNYKYEMMDKYVIYGHIIQNIVLFTRALDQNFPFESMANGDYVYIVLSLFGVQDRMYIKSNTVLGDVTHQKGIVIAEIIKANIPVENGVIHLISHPLAIHDRVLQPFPYLPIMEKLNSDPDLDYVFRIVNGSPLENVLQNTSLHLTFFIPRDSAWAKLEENNFRLVENDLHTIKKHIIISHTTYSISKLLALSRSHNYTAIPMNTLGGPLNITVLEINQQLFIVYQNKYIRIHRADYECSNGVIHIIDAPIGSVRRITDDDETLNSGFWTDVKNFFTG